MIKADAEGQKGPGDYGRTEAQGANMLAAALKPHGGIVIWRAFVYGGKGDRAVQAYNTFKPLDGKFESNVVVQVKNGPMDFQVREPLSSKFVGRRQKSLLFVHMYMPLARGAVCYFGC